MRVAVRITFVVCTLLLAFVFYEGWEVMRARAYTAQILTTVQARPLTLAAVGNRRLAMLLKVEDPGFFKHHGVDFSTPGQGATTLTQALVKRLYFKHFRPGFAKIEQSLIARYAFDSQVSKRDQLEIALNYASFGHFDGKDVIGFPAAAQTYFHKPFAALDDREYLALVAMLMGPNALDPVRHPRENADRVARIEKLLAGRCAPTGVSDVTYPACA